jgi:hypothetical protein
LVSDFPPAEDIKEILDSVNIKVDKDRLKTLVEDEDVTYCLIKLAETGKVLRQDVDKCIEAPSEDMGFGIFD